MLPCFCQCVNLIILLLQISEFLASGKCANLQIAPVPNASHLFSRLSWLGPCGAMTCCRYYYPILILIIDRQNIFCEHMNSFEWGNCPTKIHIDRETFKL
jgi:hypothetical protein